MSDDSPRLSTPGAAVGAQAEAVLREAPYAYVAMVETASLTGDAPGDARPYAVPMNFAYEAGRLYLHTGQGRKTAALGDNPRVCVGVTVDAAFDQGPAPCSDGFSFRSALVEGRATLLDDDADRQRALRAIVAKYDPGAAGIPFKREALTETLVYAVDIESMSYKTLPRRGEQ